MYRIEFYENANCESELWNFLEKLRKQSKTNKDARIQYKQIIFYIELLQNNGTKLNENITKHLDEDIWELRPGNNRIFYFFVKMILLSYCIISEKNLKKLLVGKLKKQNQKEMII